MYWIGGVCLEGKSFLKGLIVGLLAGLFLIVSTFGVLIAVDAAHLGRAADVFMKMGMFSYNQVSLTQMVDGMIEGMVKSLEDPYSAYLDAQAYENLEQNISGSYGGIGLLITENESNELEVVSPFKGTPAYSAGIKSGDIILKIGDKNTSGLELSEAANLMKGEPGTDVTLTVRPEGNGTTKTYVIKREKIHIPSVKGERLPGTKIAYINLMMFSQQTEEDLKGVLEEIKVQETEGIILDLRDNPGGDLEAAIDVAGYFIPYGTAVHIVSKKGTEALQTRDNYLDKKLVVLVNGGSASASEIVAGAVKDNKSGKIVGTTTFGKGLVQSVFEISSDTALKLTTAKYLTPDKNDIHKKGIVPDYVVEMDPELTREVLLAAPDMERDLQLQKAVSLIRSGE
jgi:carboxyl-terminal processing protease